MRAILQRVNRASVVVEEKTVGEIDKGFVVYLGIGKDDDMLDLEYLVKKICNLRIFEDENEKMNLSPIQVGAQMLVISNFTLYANTSHGFRPEFLGSMSYDKAKEYVDIFINKCKETGAFQRIESGIFGADMRVDVSVDGPINIIFDTKEIKK